MQQLKRLTCTGTAQIGVWPHGDVAARGCCQRIVARQEVASEQYKRLDGLVGRTVVELQRIGFGSIASAAKVLIRHASVYQFDVIGVQIVGKEAPLVGMAFRLGSIAIRNRAFGSGPLTTHLQQVVIVVCNVKAQLSIFVGAVGDVDVVGAVTLCFGLAQQCNGTARNGAGTAGIGTADGCVGVVTEILCQGAGYVGRYDESGLFFCGSHSLADGLNTSLVQHVIGHLCI